MVGRTWMRKDHRPLWLRRLLEALSSLYTRIYLAPQCDSFGHGVEVMGPRQVEIFGPNIHIGNHVHMQSARGVVTRLATWQNSTGGRGEIHIGDYSLITAGVHIVSAEAIRIGRNVMIAGHSYISDADWHDLYDRTSAPGAAAPITLADNVWVGYGAKILKGVQLGENTIVAAGAVVTKSFAKNLIIGGNPAKIIGKLSSDRALNYREEIFSPADDYQRRMTYFRHIENGQNSFGNWVRSKLWPTKNM